MPTLFAPYLFYPSLSGLPAAPHPRLVLPAAHDERPLRLRAVSRMLASADGIWYSAPEERVLVQRVHQVARLLPCAVGTVGVDASSTGDPERFRARTGITGRFFFYGGRMATGKGVDVLLEAYRTLRAERSDATLALAGDAAPDGGEPGVVPLGRLDSTAWADALAAAYAVIVPSRLESLSLLALDAWTAGRPCLLNRESAVLRGHADRSGGALLFATASELAGAAAVLLDDPGLADRLGAAGRVYVSANFRWDDVVARLHGLIAEAEQPVNAPLAAR